MLGKYTRTDGTTKKITDFDTKEIAGPGSQMYKDALDLAMRSGKGETDIYYGPDDAAKAIVGEDSPDPTNFQKEINVASPYQVAKASQH